MHLLSKSTPRQGLTVVGQAAEVLLKTGRINRRVWGFRTDLLGVCLSG